ncbi:MAG: D-hexose-6-phosphate mutarotase [Halioglobus sp.]
MKLASDTGDSVKLLNEKISLSSGNNHLYFTEGEGGIPVVHIKNDFGSACISLQGAHVLSWAPKSQKDVIWLSEDASYAPGKSVRGGIPICWPWFGAHASNSSFPAHGVARTSMWEVLATDQLEEGSTRITFTTVPTPENEAMWPAQTTVQYQVTLGKKLELELVTRNNGSAPIIIGQALHTYFNIGDIGAALLHGLEGKSYLDKLNGYAQTYQHGPVTIEGEVDRIYRDSGSECLLEDKSLKRSITINKRGSHSTVVWNPWQETAEKLGDMGEDGYRRMLCVESSNAAEDVVTIAPGQAHHLSVQYQVLNTP